MEKKQAPQIKAIGTERPIEEFPLEIPSSYDLDKSVERAAEEYYYDMLKEHGNDRKGRRIAQRKVKAKFSPKNAIIIDTNGKQL